MKKRNIILCTAAGVVVVAAAAGVIVEKGNSSGGGMQGGMGGPGGGPGGMGGMQQESQNTVVRAEEPETGSIYLTTELTGTVEPDDVVHVYAKASGDITAVYVKAGDTVTKGQVLFYDRHGAGGKCEKFCGFRAGKSSEGSGVISQECDPLRWRRPLRTGI